MPLIDATFPHRELNYLRQRELPDLLRKKLAAEHAIHLIGFNRNLRCCLLGMVVEAVLPRPDMVLCVHLAAAAGLATMTAIRRNETYRRLYPGLRKHKGPIALLLRGCGSFFDARSPSCYCPFLSFALRPSFS